MAGTYNVTLNGLEATALTADVVVEKDETLTKFEISPNLTMDLLANGTEATDSAICYYSALNQYGEMMAADQPTVSSSFSSKTTIERPATATVKGKIVIKEIPTVLAIQGTKGTIVLVDKNSGITSTAEVTISPAATAAEATVVGTYNTASSTMEALRAGANLENYYILLTLKDQYDNEVSADDFKAVANISLAGGLTNVELKSDAQNSLTSIAVEGKEYVAIKLKKATAQAGTYTMTIVNTKRGLLSSGTYDVIDDVVIKSVSISPKDGIYNGKENEMEYSIVDADGKEVTSYAILKALVKFNTDADSEMRWEKNANGTAKLIFEPSITDISGTTDTKSTVRTVVVNANNNTSSNYLVKTFTFTIGNDRKIKTVQGLADGTVTSVAKGGTLEIAFDKIVYADQYSNKVTKDDEKIYNMNLTPGAITKPSTGCSVAIVERDDAFKGANGSATMSAVDKKFTFTSKVPGTVDVYMKYADGNQDTPVQATEKVYDYKFTVTATDTGSVAATSLKIKSVNGGYAVNVSPTAVDKTVTKGAIEVVGTIGGAETKIPVDQYVIKEIKNGSFTDAETKAGTDSKKATVIVQVTTWDAYNNATETELTADFEVSTAKSKVFKIKEALKSPTPIRVASGAAVTNGAFQGLFKFNDQYNGYKNGDTVATILGAADAVAGNVTYEINVPGAVVDAYRVTGGGTNNASITFTASGTYTIKVTATVNGESKTATVQVVVS